METEKQSQITHKFFADDFPFLTATKCLDNTVFYRVISQVKSTLHHVYATKKC